MDICLLYLFLLKIYSYEPSLFYIIKRYIFYKFKNNDELRNAVSLYIDLETRNVSIIKYNHISLWDVSQITDMSGLFCYYYDEEINL